MPLKQSNLNSNYKKEKNLLGEKWRHSGDIVEPKRRTNVLSACIKFLPNSPKTEKIITHSKPTFSCESNEKNRAIKKSKGVKLCYAYKF